MDTSHDDCIQACQLCALSCSRCADACLHEQDPRALARCIKLDLDAAATCRLAAEAMARHSEFAGAMAAFCAIVCDRCAEECARHDHAHCQDCASMCRRCAQICRETAHVERPTRSRTAH